MLHNQMHRTDRDEDCGFVQSDLLEMFWKPRTIDPVQAFYKWIEVFFERLSLSHPESPAGRVAESIRRDFRRA